MFSTGKTLQKKFYLLGIIVIFFAVYSQYFFQLGQVTGYLVVYGIPILAVSLIFGKEIFSRSAKNNKSAFQLGLGLFGAFTALSVFLSTVALAILLQFNPQAIDLLSKPNPVLNVSPNIAWIMIALSLLVVGPAEEYIFRGFMYGGLLNMTKGRHWLPLALASSFLFTSVHAYYAITYEAASVIPFITITTFSIAMSITYYWSGGNLLVPALIHGLYDATGFLGIATTSEIGLYARGTLIFVGVLFALIFLLRKILINPKKFSPQPSSVPVAYEEQFPDTITPPT
jgi:membrane protease YdiL (CAAX protease family)